MHPIGKAATKDKRKPMKKKENEIFALGFFDGVHLGHQALLSRCCALAAQLGCQTGAITFDAHPQSLFSPKAPPLITTVHDRQQLLRQYGMHHIRCFPVIEEVMSTPWEAFLEQLRLEGAVGFVCGDDFHFGCRGEGNPEKLVRYCERHNLPCAVIPAQTHGGIRISSTGIRTLIENGSMESATRLLGHPHILTGTVHHGQQLGRKLGIPTANLWIPQGIVVPKFGVYACRAAVGAKAYPAVANVGVRPTVSGSGITVEPWILDFQGDLYDQEIRLEFYRFLRPEMKFDSLSALQSQIHQDAAQVRRYFETR